MLVLSKIVTKYAGSAGAYALALISGLADVDAISLSMARHGAQEIGAGSAGFAVLLAIISNTFVKSAMGWMMGGSGMGRRIALVSAAALVASVAALRFLPVPPGF